MIKSSNNTKPPSETRSSGKVTISCPMLNNHYIISVSIIDNGNSP